MRIPILLFAAAGMLSGPLFAQALSPRIAGIQSGLAAHTDFRFTEVDYPGALETYLFGENNFGLTTGAFQDSGQNPHAFILKDGAFKALDSDGVLGQNPSYALTCNDMGVVVGQWTSPDRSVSHGFTWQHGQVITVDYPGSSFSAVYGINDLGTLIGTWTDSNSATQGYICHHGTFAPLTGPGITSIVPYSINLHETIVGQLLSATDHQYHAFIRTPGGHYTLFDAPGAAAGSTVAISVNNQGLILGYYALADGSYHGFLKMGETYVPLDYPGTTTTVTQTLNDFSRIVGYFVDGEGNSHGFTAVPDLL